MVEILELVADRVTLRGMSAKSMVLPTAPGISLVKFLLMGEEDPLDCLMN